MLKRTHKLTNAIALSAAVAFFAGCASTQETSRRNEVKLESVDSSGARITHLYLQTTDGTVTLRGELERRSPARGPIPGHLHVELIGPDGKVMMKADISHTHKSFKSRHAAFSLPLPESLPPGGVIRVTHHDARSRVPESAASPWRDANDVEPQRER